MKLIGMLDSPYVRRVAISLDLMGVSFEHVALSVFGSFEAFRSINPVVKAPSLVLDDGSVLMDSTLILDYFEAQSPTDKKLMPQQAVLLVASLQMLGLALAACEKAVQIVYERQLRPEEKRHQPWLDRVVGQLLAACREWEARLACVPPTVEGRPDQAAITSAVAWSFIQMMIADIVRSDDFPVLHAHAARLEETEWFKRYPQV
ncbi:MULTISPECIES: glutathione S-transferase [unclassified Pseudomonas]|uniref:glutathione S-transferase n=1 Tax=unclassified Pseudomonas TaxID=196821 RepID=UPI00119AF589|nr:MULTISPECIES: glutathione S-transferase [unclassified Pseudomonas]TWC16866.1 glutathione S-transferase [Pseudomonas sp. SJZ075]TWC25915.1 glutathione S-transferase [Pseudomonas sp. SJZ074]TWC32912.1 glutathione S-transferase [Pseudomonas sp. SJZ078]TWC42726.1 glutathione S-transferase [Pseudomonas sp. SJZ085]TWC53795.1 glutathione S-transferase [Pseudomonas sp. SJZ124]